MSRETPSQRIDRLKKRLERIKRMNSIHKLRLKDRENPLEFYDSIEFKKRYHMFKSTAIYIADLIKSDLCSVTKRGVYIPPMMQFLVACRFYGNIVIYMYILYMHNILY